MVDLTKLTAEELLKHFIWINSCNPEDYQEIKRRLERLEKVEAAARSRDEEFYDPKYYCSRCGCTLSEHRDGQCFGDGGCYGVYPCKQFVSKPWAKREERIRETK